MYRRVLFVGGCVAILCTLLPNRPAWADPIGAEVRVHITDGGLTVSGFGNDAYVSIIGTLGFSLYGGATGRAVMPPGAWCTPCLPGEMSITGSHGSYSGTATLRDEVYPLGVTSGSAFLGFSTGVFVLPPVPATTPQPISFAVPFTARGSVRGYDPEDPWIYFSGAGTAHITFIANRQVEGEHIYEHYSASSVTMDFEGPNAAPTPEPASLLLIGTGLAGVVARRRRLRH